jgi:hypothetical protein
MLSPFVNSVIELLDRPGRLLRAIRADDVDPSIVALAPDADSPRAAADFAVLDEAASEIWFDVNLDFLSAIGARHEKPVFHTFR